LRSQREATSSAIRNHGSSMWEGTFPILELVSLLFVQEFGGYFAWSRISCHGSLSAPGIMVPSLQSLALSYMH
jgi:hypothetical protein